MQGMTYGQAVSTDGTALRRFLDECAAERVPMRDAVQRLVEGGMDREDAWGVVMQSVAPAR